MYVGSLKEWRTENPTTDSKLKQAYYTETLEQKWNEQQKDHWAAISLINSPSFWKLNSP